MTQATPSGPLALADSPTATPDSRGFLGKWRRAGPAEETGLVTLLPEPRRGHGATLRLAGASAPVGLARTLSVSWAQVGAPSQRSAPSPASLSPRCRQLWLKGLGPGVTGSFASLPAAARCVPAGGGQLMGPRAPALGRQGGDPAKCLSPPCRDLVKWPWNATGGGKGGQRVQSPGLLLLPPQGAGLETKAPGVRV